MSPNTLTCAVCGFEFDPTENNGCESCPIHSGCATACCPNCGTTNINPSASRLARWVERLFSPAKPAPAGPNIGLSLDQIPSGNTVRVTGFREIGPEQGRHLQAYGVLPGRELKVLSQKPLTVLQIEQTELALETIVARAVLVEEI